MFTFRTFAPAWPRTSVPDASVCKNQPAPDLLRYQRLWPDRPVCRPAELRQRGPGDQRLLGLLINPGNPRVVGPALADALTGFYAAYGILGALHERHATGIGRQVEVSMMEAMTHFNLDAFTHLFQLMKWWAPTAAPACRSLMCSSALMACGLRCTCLHRPSSGKDWPQPWSGTIF